MTPEPAGYSTYHPRWFRQPVSTYWWLTRRPYLAFILRELSSVFVAWFVVYLLLLVRAVSRGDTDYQRFLEWSRSPGIVILNAISLAFIVYHAITWFNLSAQAMVVHLGRRRVPGWWIAASNYAAWVVLSVLLGWMILRR